MTWLKIDDDHDMLWVDDNAYAMHMIYATITLGCYNSILSSDAKKWQQAFLALLPGKVMAIEKD